MTNPTAKRYNIKLTEDEIRAILMAIIFGGPDKPHSSLESARQKLREAMIPSK